LPDVAHYPFEGFAVADAGIGDIDLIEWNLLHFGSRPPLQLLISLALMLWNGT